MMGIIVTAVPVFILVVMRRFRKAALTLGVASPVVFVTSFAAAFV